MTREVRETFQCTECQAGIMHLRYITYFTWIEEELITVPNFPAWVCDVCSRREYDARAVSFLVTMLNPDTGKTAETRAHIGPRRDKRSGTRPLRG